MHPITSSFRRSLRCIGPILACCWALLSAASPSEFIDFPDAALEAIVRHAIAIPTDPLTRSDLETLTSLYDYWSSGDTKIQDLTGLEHATNLTSLTLAYHSISNLTPLAALVSLDEISLRGNEIEDLGPLALLNNLEILDLRLNRIRNTAPLSSIPQIERLNLNSNHLHELSGLYEFTSLTELRVENNYLDLSHGSADSEQIGRIIALGADVEYANQYTDPLSASNESEQIDQQGGIGSITVHSDTYWTASSNADWISIATDEAEGFASGTFSFVVDAAPDLSALRTGTISINGVQIAVTQEYVVPVAIPDLVLENSLRDTLELESGPITNVHLRNLKLLIIPTPSDASETEKLSDLSGLEYATSMERFEAYNTQLSSLEPLLALTSLRRLTISGSLLTSPSDFSALFELESLAITESQLTALPNLPQTGSLKQLHLNENAIADLSPLSTQTQLIILDLARNGIATIDALAPLVNLKYLYLPQNRLMDLTPLTNLPLLQTLWLANNHVRDLTPLTSLVELVTVDIANNFVDFDEGTPGAVLLAQWASSGVTATYTPQGSTKPILHPNPLTLTGEAQSALVALYSPTYWTASEYPDWIELETSNGFGNTDVSLLVAANEELDPRVAQIVTEGVSLSVEQAGLTPDVRLLTDTVVVPFSALGIDIQVLASTKWRAVSTADWIQFSTADHEGDGTLSVAFTSNMTDVSRIANIDFGSAVLTLTQGIYQEYFDYLAERERGPADPINWPNGDADKDGTSNRQEFNLGLDPFDANSRPSFTIKIHSVSGIAEAIITASIHPKAPSIIEYSTDLSDWQELQADNSAEEGGRLRLRHALPVGQSSTLHFYRRQPVVEE